MNVSALSAGHGQQRGHQRGSGPIRDHRPRWGAQRPQPFGNKHGSEMPPESGVLPQGDFNGLGRKSSVLSID